jgi:hypothetical protein
MRRRDGSSGQERGLGIRPEEIWRD